MSKTQAFALLLLVLPLMLATASSISAKEWQEVETWEDYVNREWVWETVETWTNPLNSILIIGPPVLISPDNDNTIYDNTPTFTWYTGANATHHWFVLDNDSDFSSVIENIRLGIITTYTYTTPLADDNYWWKVIATGGGLENSSAVWTFELLTPVAKEWYDVEIWADLLFGGPLVPYSGSGTIEDPYIIENAEGLQGMNDYFAAHYALGNDIDASATSGWNDGAGFAPIGTFTGSLDGQGYKISDLYINRNTSNYVGLFSYIGSGGVVKNMGLENVNVTGSGYVGGLVGYNYQGTVANSYSTGSVTGSSNYVGGLVGYTWGGTVSNSYSTGTVSTVDNCVGGLVGRNLDGIVSNSYSIGTVSGNAYVGGLVGSNTGTVSNCYSTGAVTGSDYVGGLVGKNFVTVSNSFWDNQTSEQSTSDGGTGKTTENMKEVRTFTDVAWSAGLATPWDFVDDPYDDVATENIWDIDEATNNGYPYLGEAWPGWLEVETWEDTVDGGVPEEGWQEVETWTDYVVSTEEWVPPGLSDEDIWAMFAIRILFIFGPLGFVAWNFTKIRNPETGLRAAGEVVICFIAIIVLWVVADAIQVVLASV